MADKGVYIEINGLDKFIQTIDKAPGNLLKISKEAMKAGGKVVARTIRSRAPSRFKRLVGYKVSEGQLSHDNYVLIGFFNKDRKKHQNDIPDWFKAYWKNYGTLTRRYPGHKFVTMVKPRSTSSGRARRNNVGQNPELFFEGAITGWDKDYMRAFLESIKRNEDKLLK